MIGIKKFLKICVFIASLLPLGWLIFALWSDTLYNTKFMTADPVQKLNRELGNWALIFIIVTLMVRPISEILNKRQLVAYRRMLGLFSLFYASLHLASYVVIDLQLDWADLVKDVTKRNFILIGFITIILMIPLAVTSNKFMIKLMGALRWRQLHCLIYPIAIFGAIHFFMMVRADFSRPIIYSTVIFALLAYRCWKKFLFPNHKIQR